MLWLSTIILFLIKIQFLRLDALGVLTIVLTNSIVPDTVSLQVVSGLSVSLELGA